MRDGERPLPVDDVDHSWSAVRGRLATLWGAARVVLGVLLVVGGVAGMLLPVLPGIPLLIAGIALLGRDHWVVRPFAQYVERWRTRHARRGSDRESP